jgi:hypothetical protein
MENCFFYISRMHEFLHRLGQILPPRIVRGMSVIPPKAAVMGKSSFGRFVPRSTKVRCNKTRSTKILRLGDCVVRHSNSRRAKSRVG